MLPGTLAGGDPLRRNASAGCNTGRLPGDCRVMATRDGFGVEELSCREVVEILGDDLEGVMAPHDRLRRCWRRSAPGAGD